MSDLSNDAKYLMNNPAFVSAIESAKSQAMTAALMCDAKDDEGRRRYLDAVRTVDKVVGHLKALMVADVAEPEVPNYYEDKAKSRFSEFMAKLT